MKKLYLILAILLYSFGSAYAVTTATESNITKQCVKKGSSRGALVRYKKCLRKQRQNMEIKQ